MTMNTEGFLQKLTSRGDIAAASLGFAAGFMIDAFLFPAGIPPGTTAGVFSVGAVGLKNSVQAALEARRTVGEQRQKREELRKRAGLLVEALAQESTTAYRPSLKRCLALWEKGILTDQHLEREISEEAKYLRLAMDDKRDSKDRELQKRALPGDADLDGR